jgi:hypothetical protein
MNSQKPKLSYTLSDFPHRTYDKIRYGDTDRQGHINNAMFVRFYETSRAEVLYDPNNLIHDEEGSFVIANLTVDFLKEEMPELVEEIAEMARKEYESKMAETEEVAAMADEKDDEEREAAKSFRKGEIGERAFMQRLLDIRAKRKGSSLADVANDKELAGIHANAGQNNVPVNNAFMSELKKIRNIRG